MMTYLGSIAASYAGVEGLVNTRNLPTRQEVAQLCEDLMQLVFPGFVKPVFEDGLGGFAEGLLGELVSQLADLIARTGHENGNEVVERFFADVPEVRRILRTDIEAAYEGDPAAVDTTEVVLAYPCIETIAIQRLAHLLYKAKVALLPRMMTEWSHSRTGIDIHPGAEIGEYFFIDHGTGVVIGETTTIGRCVKLYHGVTLGARSFAKDEEGRIVKGGKRHPNVQDEVTIYPNATILGGETTIGHHSTIGANVFLMQSVAPDTLVTYDNNLVLKFTEKNRSRNEV